MKSSNFEHGNVQDQGEEIAKHGLNVSEVSGLKTSDCNFLYDVNAQDIMTASNFMENVGEEKSRKY